MEGVNNTERSKSELAIDAMEGDVFTKISMVILLYAFIAVLAIVSLPTPLFILRLQNKFLLWKIKARQDITQPTR